MALGDAHGGEPPGPAHVQHPEAQEAVDRHQTPKDREARAEEQVRGGKPLEPDADAQRRVDPEHAGPDRQAQERRSQHRAAREDPEGVLDPGEEPARALSQGPGQHA